MNLRRALHGLVLLFLAPALAAAQTTQPAAVIVQTDQPAALYRVGEPIVFEISAGPERAGAVQTLRYRISRDGYEDLATGTFSTSDLPLRVTSTLDEPGFLRCEIIDPMDDSRRPKWLAVAGAGVDPDRIRPSMPVPDDFDEFWRRQRAVLDEHVAEPVLTAVRSPDPTIEVFDVQMDCPGGAPLSGYLALPRGANAGSLPIILHPHSAGVRSSDMNWAVRMARLGAIGFDFNAHGIPNGRPDEYYRELLETTLKGYSRFHADDIDKIYFRGMYLRLMRAVDFTASRAEWDGRTIAVIGSSQGGGQALVAAGVDPRITLCLASIPALCDHTGFVARRTSGWPKLVQLQEGQQPVTKEVAVARYYDAANFATRIRRRTVITVGFIDHVCPPTSVYAAYNAIPAGTGKKIITVPTMAHEFPRWLQEEFEKELRSHLDEMR